MLQNKEERWKRYQNQKHYIRFNDWA